MPTPHTHARILLTCLALAGCNGVVDIDAPSDASTSEGAGPPGTATGSGDPGNPTAPSPGTTTTTPGTGPLDTGGSGGSGFEESSTGCGGFICDDSEGSDALECDLFAQDCPPGDKCMPWANDGGSAWNALRCSPIVPNPDEVDEPCTVEGSGVSGIDSCVLEAMCWNVDPETRTGTCVPHCVGSPNNPLCADPTRWCSIAGDGILALCFAQCDPLDPETCDEGEGCYGLGENFVCAPDGSSKNAGGAFEACEYLNGCAPGLQCADPDAVGECEGVSGCCTPFCNIEAGMCPEPTSCFAYFDEGVAPPSYETLGLCLLEDPWE